MINAASGAGLHASSVPRVDEKQKTNWISYWGVTTRRRDRAGVSERGSKGEGEGDEACEHSEESEARGLRNKRDR